MYTCTASDGVCVRCVGKVNKYIERLGFRGNIGINTMLSLGQEKFQATLDSAKNSKKAQVQTANLFDVFNKDKVESLLPVFPSETVSIKKLTVDNFLVNCEGSTIEVDGSMFDTDYLKSGKFIPRGLVNFKMCNGDTESLEIIFFRFLEALSGNISPKSIETLISINTRFMKLKSGSAKKLDSDSESDSDNSDDEDVDKDLEISSIISITPAYDNNIFDRYWLCKPQLIAKTDVITSMCLERAFTRLFSQACERKKYDPTSVFAGKFSFEDIKEELSANSQLNLLEKLIMSADLSITTEEFSGISDSQSKVNSSQDIFEFLDDTAEVSTDDDTTYDEGYMDVEINIHNSEVRTTTEF